MKLRVPPRKPMRADDYLDEDEQQGVVEEFERAEARQIRLAKTFVGALGGVLGAMLLVFAAEQAIWPWHSRHHAELQGALTQHSVVIGELGSALAVLAATSAALLYRPDGSSSPPEQIWRKLLAFSSTVALFSCGFWCTALIKVLRRNSFAVASIWRLFWLPLVPGTYTICMAVLINSLAGLQPELAKLRAQRYRLKRA